VNGGKITFELRENNECMYNTLMESIETYYHDDKTKPQLHTTRKVKEEYKDAYTSLKKGYDKKRKHIDALVEQLRTEGCEDLDNIKYPEDNYPSIMFDECR